MTTQAIYEKRGTSIVLTNTGGTKLLNMRNLGFGVGRLSAFIDRGAAAAPSDVEVRAYCAWVATVTAGEACHFAICESDGTHTDAGLTYHDTNDAALTQAQFNALRQLGSVSAHTADTGEKGDTFRSRVSSRYYAIACYNASAAKNLADSDGTSGAIATPIYQDVQAPA